MKTKQATQKSLNKVDASYVRTIKAWLEERELLVADCRRTKEGCLRQAKLNDIQIKEYEFSIRTTIEQFNVWIERNNLPIPLLTISVNKKKSPPR